MRFSEEDEMKCRSVFPEGFFPFGYGGHSCIGKALALEVTMTAVATLVAHYRIEHPEDKPLTQFNTTNSEQILGFTEPVNGAFLRLAQRPPMRPRATGQEMHAVKPDIPVTLDVPLASTDGRLTMEEVAKHRTKESCWIVIAGKVYDITEFILVHPGGPRALLSMGGKDATRMFRDVIRHTDFAEAEKEKYLVGALEPTSKL